MKIKGKIEDFEFEFEGDLEDFKVILDEVLCKNAVYTINMDVTNPHRIDARDLYKVKPIIYY